MMVLLLAVAREQNIQVQNEASRRAHTYASDANSSAVIPSKATLPKKSSCSIYTQGAFLQDPIHGPSSTWTREADAREYIAPNVHKLSIPSDSRFRLHAVDIQVTILNFSSCSTITSPGKPLFDVASNAERTLAVNR
jgi:hypothetical protein